MAESWEKTPVFDFELGDFVTDSSGKVLTVTGGEAAAQIALKALQTVRGVYLIYTNLEDEDLDDKYGNDTLNVLRQENLTEEARLSEIERAIEEALIYDPWILEVNSLTLKRKGGPGTYGVDTKNLKGDELEASFILRTIFDDEIELQGVTFNFGD